DYYCGIWHGSASYIF
nr:immunoglobulin light chain junction region [Macaca mulatta]MOX74739.1 immunoglobulin light chain junction region [Macaca mulatta]MOX74783.1 immunoglobulin light chain junction region [Macaca mulatta]MOX74929.1 immunoglobulin light chain junction region [Macaca mulatta]MOX75100.1 immunoglobulin light chain junction region [Macaca mulatta]